jgi:hypothetical protein
MWYLHSHFEWLKLSYSSIQILLDVCLAAHLEEFLDGFPLLSKIAGSSSRLPDAQSGLIPVTLEWVPEQNHSQREKDQP